MSWILAVILIFGLCGFQLNCRQQQARSAEEQFAANTDRIAEHTGRAMLSIEVMVDQKVISPSAGNTLNDVFLKVNASNKELIQAAQKFIVVVDGKRILRFTEDGRLELEKLAEALGDAAKEAVKNPTLLDIDPNARSQLMALMTVADTAASKLIRLIRGARKITVENPGYIEIELSYGQGNTDFDHSDLCFRAMGSGHTGRASAHWQECGGFA
ncbi:MAG TPA: hypothetical protein VEF04_17905 [Blastocatellia bacterium]|nr:hypothetical protein [Blastocatellia bacterium]